MTKVTVGVDSQAACLVDGPTDDYEGWDGEIAEELLKDRTVLYVDDLRVSRSGRFLMTHPGSTGLKLRLPKVVRR